MKDHIGVDSESGLIHSLETTADNVPGLTPASEIVRGEEAAIYADAGYREAVSALRWWSGVLGSKWPCVQGNLAHYSICPRASVDEMIETAKAHIHTKVSTPFQVIKRQFGL